jgi:hypothetical protein
VAAPYASVDDFKTWIPGGLNDTRDDSVFTKVLTVASRSIDKYCNTHFWKTAVGTTRVFDACDPHWLRINDAAAVTGVATDKNADGVYEVVWTAADFQLLPLNRDAGPETEPITVVSAIGSLTFPQTTSGKRVGLVQVTGTWGWPAVPEAVIEATSLVANRLRKRAGSPEGVAGFDEFGTIRISPREDPDAVRLLTPYRTNRRAGGWAFA